MLGDSLGETLNPEARRYLDTIHDNAQQMNELIDGLLQFSRLAFEPLSSRKIEMKELFEYVLEDLRVAQPDYRVEISLADLPVAWGDPLLIRQVLANLLQNAFKYSRKRERAQIEIGFCEHGEQIAYFVRDNGAGFDMQYAGKLFGVFQRLHSADEFEGIGVGLANVRRIILRHGGEVWAEAKVDQGATFYFTLPPAQE
jgi:light-regulated signal transduction histidine kinase (bacteriophytochrome)